MEITILGSGTFIPEVGRHASSYLCRAGNKNIVFDFGRGAIENLLKAGAAYYDIDAIFITHTHADHHGEIPSLLHILCNESGLSQIEGRWKRKDALVIYGPQGIRKSIDDVKNAFRMKCDKTDNRITIVELSPGETVDGGEWKVFCFEAEHSRNRMCLSYRIEAEGKSVAYSGDTAYCKGIIDACRDVNVAILETSLPDELKGNGHMSASDAARIASEAGASVLVLTHIYRSYIEKHDIVSEAKNVFGGEVKIATDMMKIRI
ncbi:MAG: MBL fold metallo-hydrolase [Candidatus Micrarchaeota archaeon]|nr:MBL fold metallo-hydrolase [Candidatus Micrarchaeota archaeon]